MEILIFLAAVLGLVLALCLLAAMIRVALVTYAKFRGYTADDMPAVYHMVGFTIYFSVLILAHAIYLSTIF